MTIISKPWKAYNAIKSAFKGTKTSPTISSTKINVGNLKKNKETIDSLVKTTDKYVKKANEKNLNITKDLRDTGSKSLQKTDKILRQNKMYGGRMGLKFGSPNPKKTNVQKIKETFGPKNTKKLSSKQMKIAKLAGNPNKIDGADFKKLRGKA